MLLLAVGFVSGCGSGGETITGTVVTSGSARGILVGIRSGGVLQTTTVRADGTFSVSGVTLPYEAVVVSGDYSGNSSVTVLQGLTNQRPLLPGPGGISPGTPHQAKLQGSLTPPAGTTFGTYELLTLVYLLPFGTPQISAFLPAPVQDFGVSLAWAGDASVTGDLYVLASHTVFIPPPQASVQTVYDGFEVFPAVTLSDGQTRTGLDVLLQPVATEQLSGMVTYPDGFDPQSTPQVTLWVQNGLQLGTVLDVSVGSSAEFNLSVPEVPGLSFQVQASGQSDAGASYQVTQAIASFDAGPMDVTVPIPPTLEAPANQATVRQASATFQWSAVEGASLYILQVHGNGTLTVYTTETSVTLSDISALGVQPLGQATWGVGSFSKPSNVDQLVGDAGTLLFNVGDQVQTTSSTSAVTLQ